MAVAETGARVRHPDAPSETDRTDLDVALHPREIDLDRPHAARPIVDPNTGRRSEPTDLGHRHPEADHPYPLRVHAKHVRRQRDGGPAAFDLPTGALAEARAVLRDYGNMSAVTVLFVLERMLRTARPGRYLMSALGPGFTAGFQMVELP